VAIGIEHKAERDGDAAMAGRDGEVRRLALELSSHARRHALQRCPEQRRLKAPQLVEAQLLFFERQAERVGQRKNLVVVAPVRAEQRPDAHRSVCLVVHARHGH